MFVVVLLILKKLFEKGFDDYEIWNNLMMHEYYYYWYLLIHNPRKLFFLDLKLIKKKGKIENKCCIWFTLFYYNKESGIDSSIKIEHFN